MKEYLDEAKEELKRVDHLVYVSLKYTRTVDVLINTVGRMIDAYERLFDVLLEKAFQEKKIDAITSTPIERGNQIKKAYSDDDQIVDNVELYFLLRKLYRSQNPEREQEYRRHVAMKAIIDGREEILNIDIITQYYHYQMDFYRKVAEMVEES